jgi:hypothetical protein
LGRKAVIQRPPAICNHDPSGFNRLTDVLRGIKFEDGIAVLVEANDNVYEQQNIAT